MLLFVALVVAQIAAVNVAARIFFHRHPHSASVTHSPLGVAIPDALLLTMTLVATLIMCAIERRTLADFGLPLRQAFGTRFWQGVALGIVVASATIATIVLAGGGTFGGVTAASTSLLTYFAGYTIAFTLVGVAEEFLFRGYLLQTLARGIGFWPAAGIMAVVFTAAHVSNGGESVPGLASAFAAALFFSFTLRRTGSLWLAIGFHGAWDWTQTFLFGVADSGMLPVASVMHAQLSGPAWISGGATGPEASAAAFIALALCTLFVGWRFRPQAAILRERSTPGDRANPEQSAVGEESPGFTGQGAG